MCDVCTQKWVDAFCGENMVKRASCEKNTDLKSNLSVGCCVMMRSNGR
jgi:hypothetical protein